jgi:hypothetical protein
MRKARSGVLLTVVMVALLAAPSRAGAVSDTRGAGSNQTRTVVAGEQYRAGGFHRFLLGDDYRHLWTAPVTVPELDVRGFAGGLRPVMRVGGQQTLGLAMKGADGFDYTFRGIDKDPSDILPPEFHDTFVDRLLQDQIASSFPGAALAVAPLMNAAGVLHTNPILVIMPDDTTLGEFRETFAGVLGTFEAYPRGPHDGLPGFAGATEIINGETLWERLDADPNERVDARAFLTARLVDVLIGDWDRHRGQWRWAKLPDREGWQPIPEDRDQAFVRIEGLLPTVGRQRLPQFVNFGPDYPGVDGLTWNGRDGDRRLLVGLERPAWEETARELQARISDGVIDEAVARLPDAYREIEGERLAAALRARRDALPEIARAYYEFLARDVDIHCTSRADQVRVFGDGDAITVTVETGEAGVWYHRVFRRDETGEVRVYLGGGDDAVMTSGTRAGITIRVIGGDGNDTVDDTAGLGVRVSDSQGDNTLARGKGTTLDTRVYTPPARERAEWIPPRD